RPARRAAPALQPSADRQGSGGVSRRLEEDRPVDPGFLMATKPDDAPPPRKALSAHSVESWLRRHPDFLTQHPDLLDALAAPRRRLGDGVLDMQHFLVERLRGENARLKAREHALIEAAGSNRESLARVHEAALALLAAKTFD